jgi:arylsulfatase A-like enzyme
MDENVGRIIASLKQNNLYDDALIIFTSDNGGLSTQKRIAPTSVFPLRAGKGWLYEGGVRIPQLIKPPNNSQNVKIKEVTVSYDLFPTILDYAGLDSDEVIDGKSLMPIFKGSSSLKRDDIFWHFPHYHGSLWKPGASIRSGNWKLVQHFESNKLELYNLSEDIGEMNDLSSIYPDKTQDLLKRLHKLQSKTNANTVSINKNFKN